MNRALNRRAMFMDKEDILFFLALVAAAVGRGEIEIHAYTVMTNHFHMLVRRMECPLGVALRRIESEYVTYFNRKHGRTGPLVQGRFRSVPIRNYWHRLCVVAYIDRNPIDAGLVRPGEDYDYGSAIHYAHGSGPAWLTRSWIEAEVCARRGLKRYEPTQYAVVFAVERGSSAVRLAEQGLAHPASVPANLDDLIRAATPAVRAWLGARALVADGTHAPLALVTPGDVLAALADPRSEHTQPDLGAASPARPLLDILRVALLRDLAGEPFPHIGSRIGLGAHQAGVVYRRHRRLLDESTEYARWAAQMGAAALKACHFPWVDGPSAEGYGAEAHGPGPMPPVEVAHEGRSGTVEERGAAAGGAGRAAGAGTASDQPVLGAG